MLPALQEKASNSSKSVLEFVQTSVLVLAPALHDSVGDWHGLPIDQGFKFGTLAPRHLDH